MVQTQVVENSNAYLKYSEKYAPDGQVLDDTNPIFNKLKETAFDGSTVREVPIFD